MNLFFYFPNSFNNYSSKKKELTYCSKYRIGL